MKNKVIIIGGGASGLFATISALNSGKEVLLLEKNEKLGKKIYITGKGRCNLTNNVDVFEFINNVCVNPKFLFSALNSLSPEKTKEFFEENGLKLKVERGKRVFPESDKASDVTKTLENYCKRNGATIKLNTNVEKIVVEEGVVCGVIANGDFISGNSVIICTGGVSYPLTGSTGDGYKFATDLGHNLVYPKPALVGLEIKEDFYKEVQGLSLKNVTLSCFLSGKKIYSELGEMLFTHYGISGPIVLTLSSLINKKNLSDLVLNLDLKPALTDEMLENRLIREFETFNLKELNSALYTLMPKSLVPVILKNASVNGKKNCSTVTIEERKRLITAIKRLKFHVKKLRPIDEAIITSGGVNVKDVNPKTMESKLVKGLFFAGEVLDVDAFTGGFNLQIAFSTGYLAGENA